MLYFKSTIAVLLLFNLAACGQNSKSKEGYKAVSARAEPVQVLSTQEGYKKAYFASGCFWCAESIFESVFGIQEVISGYSGGTGENPTYKDYNYKGHAETVEVIYNPDIIDFQTLLTVYFSSQNVTQQNGQGPDIGSGYRSIVFYQNEEEKKWIEEKIKEVQLRYEDPVAAYVIPFRKFWKAEEYHQDFDLKNPNHPYVQNVSHPRLYKFQNKHPELLKENNKE